MSKVIRAIVETNSSQDKFNRVKLSSLGIWKMTDLVMSVNGIPLKKGDSVYVDVSEGYENPLILGRAMDTGNKFNVNFKEGTSLLFESSNGKEWTIGYIQNDILNIENSSGTKIQLDNKVIVLNEGKNGGLIVIKDLVSAINKAENKINQIINALSGLTLPVTGSTAGPPAPPPVTGQLANTTVQSIENPLIKH